MGYALSVHWFPHDRLIFTDPARLVWPIIVLLACLILGYVADLNEITLHRFYRDRLMEAFMPDDDFVNSGGTAGLGRKASHAPPSRLHKMCDAVDPKGPYHLINTHLVLTNFDIRRFPKPPVFPMNPGPAAGPTS